MSNADDATNEIAERTFQEYANEPVFPQSINELIEGVGITNNSTGGLTKREYFAAMVMQGALAQSVHGYESVAEVAVKFADALITALEKKR